MSNKIEVSREFMSELYTYMEKLGASTIVLGIINSVGEEINIDEACELLKAKNNGYTKLDHESVEYLIKETEQKFKRKIE